MIIRLTLFKSTGRTFLKKSEYPDEKDLDNLYRNLNDAAKSETEEAIINWQTKIFSKVNLLI